VCIWHTTYKRLSWYTQWYTDYDNVIISYYVSSYISTVLVIHLSYNYIVHHTWWYTYITQPYSRMFTIWGLSFWPWWYNIQNICISFEHSPCDPECIPNKYKRISFEHSPSDPECIPNKNKRISFEHFLSDPECIQNKNKRISFEHSPSDPEYIPHKPSHH